ncbi:MAG: AMP-binding protein, partial [Verrucomicrobiae bacterium]|nr:AMP-binding protein [Verrucomicrobiae bacterium]
LAVTEMDRWLCALPTFHVGGLGVYARAYFGNNAVFSFQGKWRGRAGEFVRVCERHEITLTSLTPTQVHDLVTEKRSAPARLRAVVVGGGRLDPATGEAARALGWPVLASFGMTEAGSQIATESLSALETPFSGEWLRVLSAWQVSTDGCDTLLINGRALCSGTVCLLNGEGRFKPVGLGDSGWFKTKDRAETRSTSDGASELRFLSRSDDQVKKLGELISLDHLRIEFESFLKPSGLEGVLVALPDERMEHRLVAVVESEGTDEAAASEAVAKFNQAVFPFQRIDELVMMRALPRTVLGKVAWGELKRWLAK